MKHHKKIKLHGSYIVLEFYFTGPPNSSEMTPTTTDPGVYVALAIVLMIAVSLFVTLIIVIVVMFVQRGRKKGMTLILI